MLKVAHLSHEDKFKDDGKDSSGGLRVRMEQKSAVAKCVGLSSYKASYLLIKQ